MFDTNGDNAAYDDVFSYDYNSDTWTKLGDMHNDADPNVAAYDSESDIIIVFDPNGDNADNDDVFSYDYNSDTWTKLGDMHDDADPNVAVYNPDIDRILIFESNGGNSDNDDVFSYDYNTDTWTKLGDMHNYANTDVGAYDSESDIIFVADPNGGNADYDDVFSYDYSSTFNSQWYETTVGTASNDIFTISVGDLDNDGDFDAVTGGDSNDNYELIAWQNIGGSVKYTVSSTAPSELENSEKNDILKIEVLHSGVYLDNDLELSTWNLLLEESDGDALTSSEANSIIANIFVYNDDGSTPGSYDASDTTEITISTLSLTSGVQTFTFTDNAADSAISPSHSKVFFIVVEMTSDADTQGITGLRATFDPDADSVNEDRSEDMSISVQDSNEVNTGNLGVAIPEFSSILMPILSVLVIVGINNRRKSSLDE